MLEKNVWKSDILSKDAAYIRTEYGEVRYLVRMQAASLLKNVTLPQVFFKHFASKNKLPSLSISGTFFKYRLKSLRKHRKEKQSSLNIESSTTHTHIRLQHIYERLLITIHLNVKDLW